MVKIDVYSTIKHIRKDVWDLIVRESGASPFYYYDVLSAYEDQPLQPVDKILYLVAKDTLRDTILSVFPVFIFEWNDPLHVLEKMNLVQDVNHNRLLISHFWYCYDTTIPATYLDEELVHSISDKLREIAKEYEVAYYGLVNVSGKNGLPQLFSQAGMMTQHVETRYVLDLQPFESIEDYLATIRSRHRKNIKRYVRKAMENRVNIECHSPPYSEAVRQEIVDLCMAIAAKHNNTSYYPQEELMHLLKRIQGLTTVISLRIEERLLAASVCFNDADKFHTWIGGADPTVHVNFSPNYSLFYSEVAEALNKKKAFLEAGRRNRDFKLRYGMREIPLYACLNKT